jgi:predicted nucleic acid-binding protein
VIAETVLLDAGPLVALLHDADSRHAVCRTQALEIMGRVVTTWAVVAEAAWLLRRLPNSLERLLEAIIDRDIEIHHVPFESLTWMRDCAMRYRDLRPQAADLTLLYLAQQLRTDLVFSLDRRDFAAYRTSSGKPFHLLPEFP